MKILSFALACIGLTLLMSCSASQEVTNFWRNPDYKGGTARSVFILALTQDQAARNTLESDLGMAAQARGHQVVRSVDVYPAGFSKQNAPSKEDLAAKIKERGCDVLFTISLLDQKSEQRYVPGSTTYAPYPTYGYYGSYGGYYDHVSPVVYDPGYYVTDHSYFIEGNLYDVATGNIIFSMQSSAYNPSSIADFSKGYTALLVSQLDKATGAAKE